MTSMPALPPRSAFPQGFLFGTATSAYQIEGHRFGGAGRTHWDSFAATPGNVAGAEDGAVACDHYHRWAEDLDLVAALNADVYRFSTSWARVMPEGTGPVNPQGLDFYDRLVDGMLARGLKPAVTLYHWELPQALADRGGWRNADMPDWFAEFTQAVMARIGDRVWSAAPVNEPWCVAWLSHFEGHHAPGLRDIRAAARAMHHVLLAHGRSIGVMRDLGIRNLGAVVNLEGATPASDTAEDHAAADRRDAIYNRAFLEPLFLGRYPEALLEGIAPHLPDGWQDDFDTIRAPVDWIGVNYYTRRRIAAAPGAWPGYAEAPPRGPCTGIGWEIHPEGLADFLRRVARDYSGDLPILVTENGMAGDGLTDSARITYLAAHLQALRTAIAEGVPVTGYFVWSLMDNYEWALGYAARFGLVHVDFESLARHPKASYQALAHAWARDGLANGPKAP